MEPGTVDAAPVYAALTAAAARNAELLRSGLDPAARVPGLTWSAAETAAHLVADMREHIDLLTGAHSAPEAGGAASERGAAANRAQLDAFPERDLTVLAGLLEEAVAEFRTAATSRADQGPMRTANGVMMTPATLSAIFVGEQLIHGLDLARSAGRSWPVPRQDAMLTIPGVMAILADYLDRQTASTLTATYELRFPGGVRYRFAVDKATATAKAAATADGRPDCVISADPAAFLLVGYGRAGQWSQILRGKLRAGGRRPWLALRFSSLLTPP